MFYIYDGTYLELFINIYARRETVMQLLRVLINSLQSMYKMEIMWNLKKIPKNIFIIF